MIKKYAQFLITSFQTLSQTYKNLIIVIIFHKKLHIHSQLSLKRLKNTPVFSILKKRKLDSVFSFRKTTQEEVLKVSQDLNAKKICQASDTPTKIIKLNSDIFSNLIYKHFNCCIDKGEFLNDLKHVDIVPIYKKNNKCEKENYRPVSILSNLSKIYENLMYNQLYEYFVASGKGIVLNIVF